MIFDLLTVTKNYKTMKTIQKTTAQRTGLMLILFGLITFVSFSCSKDDDPTDNDIFIGKYKGHITYTEGETHIDADKGNVEVIKVGKDYNFIFSDKIPNLTDVKFEKDGENTVINIGSDEAHLIKINASTLVIAYTKDGKVWTANCSR